MAHVFVSYAHEDEEFVTQLHGKLSEAGVDVWQDVHDIRTGDNWGEEINDAIANSVLLILVLSAASARSQYVTYEFAFATGARIPVLPVLIGSGKFHPHIRAMQMIDFRKTQKWDRLVRDVRKQMDINISLIRRSSEALSAPQKEERSAAQEQLRRLRNNPFARDEIVRATRSPIPDVREWAISLLVNERDVRVVPKLIDRLRDDFTRDSALTELENLVDESTGPQIVEMLSEGKPELVECALQLLENVGGSVIPILLETWNSKGPLQEKAAALRALGKLGVREPLVEARRLLMSRSKVLLRIASVEYLGRIGDTATTPQLMNLLNRQSVSEHLRGAAAIALARMKHLAAIPVVLSLIDYARVRWEAIGEALLRFDTTETRKAYDTEKEKILSRIERLDDDRRKELAYAAAIRMFKKIERRAKVE